MAAPFINTLSLVADTNIGSALGISIDSIGTLNGCLFDLVPVPDLLVQISLADGSWQEPETPAGWQHFHRDQSRIGLVDSNDNPLDWLLLRDDICQGSQEGEFTDADLYPDVCEIQMNTEYQAARTYTISGLDDTKSYNFEFWSGLQAAARPWESNFGRTQWTIEGFNPVSIQHKSYTGSPVRIDGVYPQGGSIDILCVATTGATYYYFNVLVIRQFTP
ncbi:MAG: hypothetical protein D4R67_10620 [Bacteroidetes bacterium]|nr:MAG: hypothetical protein D4R67_10620 [Bacteroidota bacterium]